MSPVNHVLIQNALRLKVQSLSLLSTTAFARATTACYIDSGGIVRTAAINVVRNAHYIAGVGPQVLYEPTAATNAMLWSNDFSNGVWVPINLTVTTGIADPAGGAGASTLTSSGGNSHALQTLSAGASIVRTNSIWARRRTGTGSVFLRDAPNTGFVDISGTLSATWQRFSITASASTVRKLDITVNTNTDAVDVWCAQQDDAAVMSSEIPTTNVAITRAAEVDCLFSATASGYARQTGSFLTEGFGAGMEIRETGFASNPIATITGAALDGLSITVNNARSVETAAAGRKIYVGIPNDFAWENVKFSPTQGRPYVEEDYIPGPMSLNSLGALGNITAEPMYHLNVYVPQNSGIEADGGYADAILTLFAPSTEMVLANGDKLFVRADVAPFMGQRQQVSGNSVIPITIPLRLFTTNWI